MENMACATHCLPGVKSCYPSYFQKVWTFLLIKHCILRRTCAGQYLRIKYFFCIWIILNPEGHCTVQTLWCMIYIAGQPENLRISWYNAAANVTPFCNNLLHFPVDRCCISLNRQLIYHTEPSNTISTPPPPPPAIDSWSYTIQRLRIQ